MTPSSYSLSDFVGIGPNIGSGAFGTVRKVVHVMTEEVFAMKIIPKSKIVENNMTTHLHREVRTQLQIEHPHIIQLFHFFEDSDNVHLLLEYASEGSLFSVFKSRGHLPEREAVHIFIGIASALDHLHQQNIVHRDVKPENILLCAGGVAKLADFGWCAELVGNGNRKTFCGTWDYLSPEMIDGESHDHNVDIWAMGVLLFEMLVGCPPFAAKTTAASLRRIQSVDLDVPTTVSSSARELIFALLVLEPHGRLGLSVAQCHSWVRQCTALEESAAPPPESEGLHSSPKEQRPMGKLKLPYPEKLHCLELYEEDEEPQLRAQEAVPPLASFATTGRAVGQSCRGSSAPPGKPSVVVSQRQAQRLQTWKETTTFAAVRAFIQKDATAVTTVRTPCTRKDEREARSRRSPLGLSSIESVKGSGSSSLEATLPVRLKFEDSPQPAAADKVGRPLHRSLASDKPLESMTRERLVELVF